jgi:transposase InsO family protein
MKAIYDWLGISRQAFYQHQRRRVIRQAMEKAVCEQVRQIRQRHPQLGTRKLWQEMKTWMATENYKVGRDRLFDILRRHDLLVQVRRRRRRTTWAGHWRCPNLLAEKTVTRPNQAWVSDITYVETEQGFTYLFLVTDLFARRIMGFDLATSLTVEGALRALKMACHRGRGSRVGLIHHSDHGVQYTCHAYRQALANQGMRSSMGAVGNCYDNAVAERINGILKLEYGLGNRYVSLRQARRAVREAIWLYNHERPHLSLNYQKPHQVYINGTSSLVH